MNKRETDREGERWVTMSVNIAAVAFESRAGIIKVSNMTVVRFHPGMPGLAPNWVRLEPNYITNLGLFQIRFQYILSQNVLKYNLKKSHFCQNLTYLVVSITGSLFAVIVILSSLLCLSLFCPSDVARFIFQYSRIESTVTFWFDSYIPWTHHFLKLFLLVFNFTYLI